MQGDDDEEESEEESEDCDDDGGEESTLLHINVVKNKLSGWHGRIVCDLDYKTARYTA